MTQEDAWWGLDRIDQRALPLDGEYAYETCDEAAPATDVYIFDTGVRCSHMEFDALAPGGARRCVGAWDAYNPGAGDVRECANAPPGSQDSCARDNDSHGTHVAATAAGARCVVRPQLRARPLREERAMRQKKKGRCACARAADTARRADIHACACASAAPSPPRRCLRLARERQVGCGQVRDHARDGGQGPR